MTPTLSFVSLWRRMNSIVRSPITFGTLMGPQFYHELPFVVPGGEKTTLVIGDLW